MHKKSGIKIIIETNEEYVNNKKTAGFILHWILIFLPQIGFNHLRAHRITWIKIRCAKYPTAIMYEEYLFFLIFVDNA